MKEENRGITFCCNSGVCGDLFIGKMCLQGNNLWRKYSQGNVNEELVIQGVVRFLNKNQLYAVFSQNNTNELLETLSTRAPYVLKEKSYKYKLLTKHK
jgi:hypothetical protein